MSLFVARIKGFVRFKDLMGQLVSRDLKLKYRRSVLGYLWSVLNPLFIMIIMAIVFSKMFTRALLVRLALGGVGKEEAHLARLRNGQRIVFVENGLPSGLGVDRQAVVEAQRDIERLAELFAQLRGNEQTALGVDRVFILAVHVRSPLLSLHFHHLYTTWLHFTYIIKAVNIKFKSSAKIFSKKLFTICTRFSHNSVFSNVFSNNAK